MNEYVVIGNFNDRDHKLRFNSKVFVVGGTNGDGWEKRKCVARRRDGSLCCMWLDMKKVRSFRPAWLPQHVRDLAGDDSAAMSKDDAMQVAAFLNERHGN
jgi:hypothetical protein